MSMDDILNLLVESRKQGQSSQQSDPMTDLIGGLLGGGGTSDGGQADAMTDMLGSLLGGGQSQTGGQQQSGLSGMMSLLEMFTHAGGQSGLGQSSMMGSNPLMGLMQPLVEPLAKKLKIPPELAMVVISFVLQKLLAHHPASGRDSTQFNIDDMFSQLGSGKLDPNMIRNSGMVEELSHVTGMDQATATKSLNTAFTMVGQRALQAAGQTTAKPAGKTLKGAASSGKKNHALDLVNQKTASEKAQFLFWLLAEDLNLEPSGYVYPQVSKRNGLSLHPTRGVGRWWSLLDRLLIS